MKSTTAAADIAPIKAMCLSRSRIFGSLPKPGQAELARRVDRLTAHAELGLKQTGAHYRPLATASKLVAVQLPIEFMAGTATTEINMAMNPYSIAVAPEVLRHIEEKIFASPAMIICSVGGWIYETAIEQTKRLTACS